MRAFLQPYQPSAEQPRPLVPQIHRPPMFLTFFAEREVRNEADRLLQVTRVNQPHRPPKDLVNRRELADEAVRRYKIVNNVYGPKCSIRIILLNSCPEMLRVVDGGTMGVRRIEENAGQGSAQASANGESFVGEEEATKMQANTRKTATVQNIQNSLTHKWGRDGSHLLWRTGPELQDVVMDFLGYKMPTSTAYEIVARERERANSSILTVNSKKKLTGACLDIFLS